MAGIARFFRSPRAGSKCRPQTSYRPDRKRLRSCPRVVGVEGLEQRTLLSVGNSGLAPPPLSISPSGAFEFTGAPGGQLEIPHQQEIALAQGTIALDFSVDNALPGQALFSKDAKGYGAGGHLTALVRDGRLEARLQSTSDSVTLKTPCGSIRDGVPYHLAVTFGPGGFNLYLDGQLAASRADVTTSLANNSETLALGANIWARDARCPTWAADFLDGTISDFAIYDRALSDAEIDLVAGETYQSPTAGTTGTGLDQLIDIILNDPGLNCRVPEAERLEASLAADQMNQIIVEAIIQTGIANDGTLNIADIRDVNTYIRGNYPKDGLDWVLLHGDDENCEETGFHLVQNDGATTRLMGGYNAVDTVADGIYHLGFEICGDQILNEDGNANASLESLSLWLGELLEEDLAAGSLSNAVAAPPIVGTTSTGLDQLISIITTDVGLNRKVSTSDIQEAAWNADQMNLIIVEAIVQTGAANDATLDKTDIREINGYIRQSYSEQWVLLHGDDEGDEETGFHLVQNDGATSRLFAKNAVDTVADGIYHLGFEIRCNRLLNEDGNENASLESVAFWLSDLLGVELQSGILVNQGLLPDPQQIAENLALELPAPLVMSGVRGQQRELPHNADMALAEGTIALSFTVVDSATRQALFSKDAKGYGAGGHITAFVQNGLVEVRLQRTQDTVTLKTACGTIRDGIPYDLAVTFGPGGFNLYLDGQLAASRSDVKTSLANNTETLALGANISSRDARCPTWAADFLDGTISEFAMYDRALSPAEIDLVAGEPYQPPTTGTTGTGLDQLIDIILADPGLNCRVPDSDRLEASLAADQMNQIIIEAIVQTGIANDGTLNIADIRDVNAYIRENYPKDGLDWVLLHGDDENCEETGFHLVQNDGATTRLMGGYNAVDTVADGIYHLGFEICGDQILNEDGNANASLESLSFWLTELLAEDLAAGSLSNAAAAPPIVGTTGTGLDQLISIITTDLGLNRKVSTSEIQEAAWNGDQMNQIIVEAIVQTGAANDGSFSARDIRAISSSIRSQDAAQAWNWMDLHGDDEGDEETAFHLVQNDGATSRLFAKNAVDTVADGIYHLGFEIRCNRLLNEDGNENASLESVAFWLNELLAGDIASNALVNTELLPDPQEISAAMVFSLDTYWAGRQTANL